MAKDRDPHTWRPIDDLPEDAENWGYAPYHLERDQWFANRQQLRNPTINKPVMDTWLAERQRRFAIENGQIEGLYLLRSGITEQLVAEGLELARGMHSVQPVLDDSTLQGLLQDQQEAIESVFANIVDRRPLSKSMIREWHALLTRHQNTAPGVTPTGRRVGIPLLKGAFKTRPNNPRTASGRVHEYCPPEHVEAELDRLLALHRTHGNRFPTEVEAAWLHHRYVQIHPFQDGNGRTGRLLMGHAFIARGEFPPLITTADRPAYIDALDDANRGDLQPLIQLFGGACLQATLHANRLARAAQSDERTYHHGTGAESLHLRAHQPPPRTATPSQAWLYGDTFTREPHAASAEPSPRRWHVESGERCIRIFDATGPGEPVLVHAAPTVREAARWIADVEGKSTDAIEPLARQLEAQLAAAGQPRGQKPATGAAPPPEPEHPRPRQEQNPAQQQPDSSNEAETRRLAGALRQAIDAAPGGSVTHHVPAAGETLNIVYIPPGDDAQPVSVGTARSPRQAAAVIAGAGAARPEDIPELERTIERERTRARAQARAIERG